MCIQHFVRFSCGCERNTEFAQCNAGRRLAHPAHTPYPTPAQRTHMRTGSVKCVPTREGAREDGPCPCHATHVDFGAAFDDDTKSNED